MGAGTAFPITSSKPAFLHHSHRTHRGLDLSFSDPSNVRPSTQPQNIGFLFSGFSNPRQLFSDFVVVLLLLPRFQPYPSLRQKLICSASRVTRGLGNKVKNLHGFWDYHTPPPKCTYHIEHKAIKLRLAHTAVKKPLLTLQKHKRSRQISLHLPPASGETFGKVCSAAITAQSAGSKQQRVNLESAPIALT